jgi:hypothetical protein
MPSALVTGARSPAPTAPDIGVAGPASPITDDRPQHSFNYWLRLAAGRRMPSRADIHPGEIIKLLPHVMLVDVLGEGRYRYRLIGTANMQEHGFNATGRYLDESCPAPNTARTYFGSMTSAYNPGNPFTPSRCFCRRNAKSPSATQRCCSFHLRRTARL